MQIKVFAALSETLFIKINISRAVYFYYTGDINQNISHTDKSSYQILVCTV